MDECYAPAGSGGRRAAGGPHAEDGGLGCPRIGRHGWEPSSVEERLSVSAKSAQCSGTAVGNRRRRREKGVVVCGLVEEWVDSTLILEIWIW